MRYYKEILLIEGIILVLLWIANDYLASLITFIFVPLLFSIIIISYITERISKSNIPSSYFKMMWGLLFIPIIFIAIFSKWANGLDWMAK